MDARFRIRTRTGEEMTPGTLEIFSELVRSGVVKPDDLVFDALTGEWAPARVHPMVRLLLDPLATDPSTEQPSERVAGDLHGGQDVLELDLVEPPSVTPAAAAAAFIAQMEEERRHEPASPEVHREMAVLDLDSGLGARPGISQPSGASVGGRGRRPSHPLGAEGTPGSHPSPPPRRIRRRRVVAWRLAVVVPVLAVAGWLSYGRPSLGLFEPASGTVGLDPVQATPPRETAATEEGIRGVAYQGLLRALDDLRASHAIEAVPPNWLEGQYLADPASYPEAREFWVRYASFAAEARSAENGLYREAYLDALIEAGVTGPVRSLRLATALEDFETGHPQRLEHYLRASELAAASLALHDMLLGAEGRVTHEPARSQRLSLDPVLEAAGQDAEMQSRLEAALDRVLEALLGAGAVSPADRALVPSSLVDGLRTVGTGATPQVGDTLVLG